MRPGQDYSLYGGSREVQNRRGKFEAGGLLMLAGMILAAFACWEYLAVVEVHDPAVPIPPNVQAGGRRAVFGIPVLLLLGGIWLMRIGYVLCKRSGSRSTRGRRQYPIPWE